MTRHSIPSKPLSRTICAIFLLLVSTTIAIASASLAPYIKLSPQTEAMLARGDTALVFQSLADRLINSDKDYEASLDRGWLYLGQENRELAKKDLMNALGSPSDSLRISAYCGLAWCSYRPGLQSQEAMDYLKRALSVDKNSMEALYTKTVLTLSDEITTDDARVAKRSLFPLLEADLAYRDVYRLWRDVILDHTEAEIRQVDSLLTAYLEAHPDSAQWRLDLAWNRYLVDGPDAAQEELGRLQSDNPAFAHSDRHLLDARCHLELGDTVAFQDLYWKAVDLAGETGQVERLISDASTIFTPQYKAIYEKLAAEGKLQKFLHFYWADIDPVKINPVNLRLAEHYTRLGYAQRNYRLSEPHNSFNTNQDANRLLGFQGAQYEHKSEMISFSAGMNSGLDHRGLLFMRYGPPEYQKSHLPSTTPARNLMSNPLELWYYDGLPFIFEKLPMAGGYISRPLLVSGMEKHPNFLDNEPNIELPSQGDIQAAMARQMFRNPEINECLEYYVAQFAAPAAEGLELEIYQDEVLPEGMAPDGAEVVAYDTLWNERDRISSRVFKIPGEKENRWVAVHIIPFPPGETKYAFSLEAGGLSWNGRGSLNLPAFDSDFLELSAVVLGLEPPQDSPTHERRGVAFIPRPSFKFKQGEVIRVYLEYNNLAVDHDRMRSYREYIDVIRYEGEWGALGKLTGSMVGILTFGEPKEQTQVNFTFDREVEYAEGPVAETFLIDTSELKPGKYRLLIEARDNVNLFWDNEAVMFEVD